MTPGWRYKIREAQEEVHRCPSFIDTVDFVGSSAESVGKMRPWVPELPTSRN